MTTIANLNKLKDIVEKDNDLKDMNGGILYSSHETLKKGKYYFLGVHPGRSCCVPCQTEGKYYFYKDDPSKLGAVGGPKILDHLKGLNMGLINAFADGPWKYPNRSYEPGEAPLQKKVQKLFKFLGTDIKDVCSSNLIFKPSPNTNNLDIIQFDDICWKIHKVIIEEIVKPEFIISYGRDVFHSLKAHRKFQIVENGKTMWVAKKENTHLINFPHFSAGRPPYDPFAEGEKETLNKLKEITNI